MKRIIVLAASIAALALAGTASAALTTWIYDPGNTGCPTSSSSNGVLHLAKNCATTTNAAAGATVSGASGQPFTSASFTLPSTAQCQGGSPRFNVVTSTGTFFLGCNNVTPTTNADGSVTYTFNAATIAAGNNPSAFPTGTITSVDVMIDVQGTADLSNITLNGQPQTVPSTVPSSKSQCKHDGWKTFTSPSFKNQGQCVRYVEHQKHLTKAEEHAVEHKSSEKSSDKHGS